ncbi:hypothetical protein OIT41_20130 (plasmid) [Arthrobacter sp. YA7-1]|uniref:hypothetical protein n=1 Tax=Arthrobacter sp. YA7-1 TaxID=2987701 RepID=UPI0022268171|nr:hypothetical protein [Arthrobacter sp. YA7-1]UYY83563.1 hypothetical protein OIT41_20130 [Arthrobacter sp. YA7-1]
MTGLVSDPADLLRPISTAVKVIGAPILQNARDHENYQHLLVQQLAPLLNDLEAPLRAMRAASPYLDKEATDELHAVAQDLNRLARSMAAPAWWKKPVFWMLTDCRPIFKQFTSDLSAAATVAISAQPKFADWQASKPHPQYIGDLDPQTLKEAQEFWAKSQDLEALRLDLNARIDAARASREVADEFFHEWMRGRGFVKKSKH